MTPEHAVSIVIPAYNEENGIGDVVTKVDQILQASDYEYEIIIVDDGSSDRTSEVASATGARVLRHVQNIGYGGALKSGIRAAQYPFVCITDADGTYPWPTVRREYEALKAEAAERRSVGFGDGDYEAARTRRLVAQAEVAEFRAAELRGETVTLSFMSKEFRAAVDLIGAEINNVPARYGAVIWPHDPGGGQLLLEEIVAELLEAIVSAFKAKSP